MKQKLKLLLAVALLCSNAFAQKNWLGDKKGSLVGISFNLADFKGPSGIKDPVTGKVYGTVPQMDKGLSISYWKGLTSKIDLSVKLSGMSYSELAQSGNGNSPYGFELEPTLNIRPFKDAAKISPFLTAGVGGGLYNKDFMAYVPAGVGAQVNFSSLTYFFVQAQYRFSLDKTILGDNLFYSIGFAQHIK